MKFDHIEARICTHYLPALINGDLSGLTDEEAADLEAFEKYVRDDRPVGYWDCDSDDEGDFGRDEVTGLMGTVCTVRYHFPV